MWLDDLGISAQSDYFRIKGARKLRPFLRFVGFSEAQLQNEFPGLKKMELREFHDALTGLYM